MPAWCTISEIEDLMSAPGVSNSTNDTGGNAVADATITDNAIERGQSKLAQYLNQKYDTAAITSANVWVKWATATFAAVEIMRRKGGMVPPGLQEIFEEYITILEKVAAGLTTIPGLYPRSSPGIAVSNITVDNAYRRAKIRRVDTISFPVSLTSLPQFRDRFDFGLQ